jgi:hypothetical protein
MALGIALMAIGAFGTIALAGFLVGASTDGTLGLWAIGSVDPRLGAAIAAVVGAAAVTLILLGWSATRRVGRRQLEVQRLDRQAHQAEQEARATLLAMRLDVLQREVDVMEGKRDAVVERFGAPRAPAGVPVYTPAMPGGDDEVVVIADD